MKSFEVILSCLFIFSAGSLSSQTHLKKTFLLGDKKDFLASSCQLVPECDCCSAELILLTTSKFAIIDRCVSGDTFYAGTYSIKDSELTLTFAQKVVNEEVNETTNTTSHKLRPFKIKDQLFSIKPCGESMILEGHDSLYDLGIATDESAEVELRKELANSPAFKKLEYSN